MQSSRTSLQPTGEKKEERKKKRKHTHRAKNRMIKTVYMIASSLNSQDTTALTLTRGLLLVSKGALENLDLFQRVLQRMLTNATATMNAGVESEISCGDLRVTVK